MMNRITNKQIQYRIDTINTIFERLGKNTQWQMAGRNGYQAIDSGPADGYTNDMVITGQTKRNIYEQLGIALDALAVINGKPLPNISERKKIQKQRTDAIEKYNARIKNLGETK